MTDKERLIEFIKTHSFLRSDIQIFRLASGRMSNFYFDLRKTTLSPEGQYLIGNIMCDKLKELNLKPDAIGGLTMGADPIATATAYCSYLRGNPIEAFVIRKEQKSYGTGLQIEGNIRQDGAAVIIDDVITTGGSTIKAIDIARKAGLNILSVIVLLDRCEQNGRENVEKQGLPVYSILTVMDFKGLFPAQQADA